MSTTSIVTAYLELIIAAELIVATFAAVVLTIYIYGIRTIGDWMTSRYGVKPGVIEALLILGLTLVAAPMRRWLGSHFRKLFERETGLYREIVARIGSHPGQYRQLPELLRFGYPARTALSLGSSVVAIRRLRLSSMMKKARPRNRIQQPQLTLDERSVSSQLVMASVEAEPCARARLSHWLSAAT